MWQASALYASKRKRLNLLFPSAALNSSEINTGITGKEKARNLKSWQEILKRNYESITTNRKHFLASELTRVFHWPFIYLHKRCFLF